MAFVLHWLAMVGIINVKYLTVNTTIYNYLSEIQPADPQQFKMQLRQVYLFSHFSQNAVHQTPVSITKSEPALHRRSTPTPKLFWLPSIVKNINKLLEISLLPYMNVIIWWFYVSWLSSVESRLSSLLTNTLDKTLAGEFSVNYILS